MGRQAVNRQARVSAYCNLRLAGKSKIQTAASLGIGLATATTYEREYEQLRAKLESNAKSQSNGVISKTDLAVRLSQVIADPATPPQYLAALSRALADIEGYNAPKSIDLHDSRPIKPISELLDQWNKERTGGAPPENPIYLSSGQSPAATSLGKRLSQPPENKGVSAANEVSSKEVKEVLASVIVSNDLENEKPDASTK